MESVSFPKGMFVIRRAVSGSVLYVMLLEGSFTAHQCGASDDDSAGNCECDSNVCDMKSS